MIILSRTAIVLLAVLTSTAAAEESVRLPWVFGDHMVLQRGRPVPVWGEAAPGEEVRVSFSPFAAGATASGCAASGAREPVSCTRRSATPAIALVMREALASLELPFAPPPLR